MSNTVKENFKVKDISLSDWGKRKLAEANARINSLREEYKGEFPLKGQE